jgi:transcriptional regulator with XRE-family HTH domain
MSSLKHTCYACVKHNACVLDIRPVSLYKQAMTPDPLYKHIGAMIKARRKTLGLKQAKLAGMLGISRGSLANIETGRQSVLVHQLYRFAAALELMPFDLLPAPLPEHSRSGRAELPLPDGLNSEQKEQITLLIEQVDTDPTRAKEGVRAKTTKH